MTVENLSNILRAAIDGRYAVAGLVVLGWEDAVAYIEAADECNIPIILQAGPGCRRHTPVAILGKMFRHLAEQARVPVACHIDHAYTVEECFAGIDHGFTSVMIDGSKLEIGANIALTAEVVARAHAAGVSVEGEVGVVGYAGSAASKVTSMDDARRFDSESGADALAISVGNLHLNSEKSSNIDFAALKAIESATRLPLVLHGGSGIPLSQRQWLARETRVKKLNIGTELRMAFGNALRRSVNDHPDWFDRIEILRSTVPAVKSETMAVLQVMQAEGR